MWCFAPIEVGVVPTHTPSFIVASNVSDLGTTSRVLCACLCIVVYVWAPDAASLAEYVYNFAADAVPGLSVCMCICLLLTPLPGLGFASMSCPGHRFHCYPLFTTLMLLPRVFCVYVCVVCVYVPDTASRTMFRYSHPCATTRAECMFTHGGVAHSIFPTNFFLQLGVSDEQAY